MQRRVLMTALAVLMTVGMAAPPAIAATPPLVNWGVVNPGVHVGTDTTDSDACVSGSSFCVEQAIRWMNRDLDRMLRTCTHQSMFQLAYTRTTEAYYESSKIDGFYSDVAWMHHYDVVFASYYFGPQKAWKQGRISDIPPSWQEAFHSAAGQELTSSGNFLMGMNAHINRDLPFVLRDIGLTDADGNSRKPDHEKVNEFLNNVGDDLTPEVNARLDPNFDTNPDDDVLAGIAVQQVIQEWRERAWNNAWLMANADPVVAELVAQGIEAGSAVIAQQVRDATAYEDDVERLVRNAWCDEHGGDWDGGDGTFFDEDPPTFGGLSTAGTLPRAALTLSELALLGVHVDASPTRGIQITLS